MIQLVFLLEEESMRLFLERFLQKILPEDAPPPVLVKHQGKSDLDRNTARRLRDWRNPGDIRFVIVRDQHGEDCVALKRRLRDKCEKAGRGRPLIRIVCQELESWLLGDLEALQLAFPDSRSALRRIRISDPDACPNANQIMESAITGYRKTMGAREIAPHLDPARNRSRSFQVFVEGVRRLAQE